MLYWRNSSYSTTYPYPSIKYINHMHCGKALYSTTILNSVETLPFIFCFCNSSIIEPDPMDIIDTVGPLQSGCAANDAPTHHLTKLSISDLSMSGRFRDLLYIWAPSQAFPSHPNPVSLYEYIEKKWTSWCLSWIFKWQIVAVPMCGGMLFPIPCIVTPACN